MAGLLCSSKPEKVASSQEPWWSSPSRCSSLEQREAAQHQHRLQGDKSPMDSQGNSSEAWDNQGLPSPLGRSHGSSPETDYQYCDPSMSPPLHPSKRHAPNPPPISNQATKGLEIRLLLLLLLMCRVLTPEVCFYFQFLRAHLKSEFNTCVCVYKEDFLSSNRGPTCNQHKCDVETRKPPVHKHLSESCLVSSSQTFKMKHIFIDCGVFNDSSITCFTSTPSLSVEKLFRKGNF